MTTSLEESRHALLDLLDQQRLETRLVLSGLDPERVVHDDERAWRVRDILGHLGVWNGEAARSLEAHARGEEYTCIESEAAYYDYNGPAADERKLWTLDEVWAEYEASHDQLKAAIEAMPASKWATQMLFPWGECGTVEQLVRIMMNHEKVDHCALILGVTAV